MHDRLENLLTVQLARRAYALQESGSIKVRPKAYRPGTMVKHSKLKRALNPQCHLARYYDARDGSENACTAYTVLEHISN